MKFSVVTGASCWYLFLFWRCSNFNFLILYGFNLLFYNWLFFHFYNRCKLFFLLELSNWVMKLTIVSRTLWRNLYFLISCILLFYLTVIILILSYCRLDYHFLNYVFFLICVFLLNGTDLLVWFKLTSHFYIIFL